jgi:hypothetical protein
VTNTAKEAILNKADFPSLEWLRQFDRFKAVAPRSTLLQIERAEKRRADKNDVAEFLSLFETLGDTLSRIIDLEELSNISLNLMCMRDLIHTIPSNRHAPTKPPKMYITKSVPEVPFYGTGMKNKPVYRPWKSPEQSVGPITNSLRYVQNKIQETGFPPMEEIADVELIDMFILPALYNMIKLHVAVLTKLEKIIDEIGTQISRDEITIFLDLPFGYIYTNVHEVDIASMTCPSILSCFVSLLNEASSETILTISELSNITDYFTRSAGVTLSSRQEFAVTFEDKLRALFDSIVWKKQNCTYQKKQAVLYLFSVYSKLADILRRTYLLVKKDALPSSSIGLYGMLCVIWNLQRLTFGFSFDDKTMSLGKDGEFNIIATNPSPQLPLVCENNFDSSSSSSSNTPIMSSSMPSMHFDFDFHASRDGLSKHVACYHDDLLRKFDSHVKTVENLDEIILSLADHLFFADCYGHMSRFVSSDHFKTNAKVQESILLEESKNFAFSAYQANYYTKEMHVLGDFLLFMLYDRTYEER